MSKQVNTISRFVIAFFFIASGISRIISQDHMSQVAANMGLSIPPAVMLVIVGIEVSGGLFLFLGYKIDFVSTGLIIATLLTTILFQEQLLPVVKNGAVIAGLLLLINRGGGETFVEYARADIEDLPEYNTRSLSNFSDRSEKKPV